MDLSEMRAAPDALGKEVIRPQEIEISIISALSGALLAQILCRDRLAELH